MRPGRCAGAAAARTAGPGTARPAAGWLPPATSTRTRPASSAPSRAAAARAAAWPACSRSPDSNASRASASSASGSVPNRPIDSTSAGSPSSSAEADVSSARASRSASASAAAAGRPPSPSNAARRVSGGVSSRSAAAVLDPVAVRQDLVRVVERVARLVELPRPQIGPDRLRQLPVLGRRHGLGVGVARCLARGQLPLLLVVDDPVLPQVGVRLAGALLQQVQQLLPACQVELDATRRRPAGMDRLVGHLGRIGRLPDLAQARQVGPIGDAPRQRVGRGVGEVLHLQRLDADGAPVVERDSGRQAAHRSGRRWLRWRRSVARRSRRRTRPMPRRSIGPRRSRR